MTNNITDKTLAVNIGHDFAVQIAGLDEIVLKSSPPNWNQTSSCFTPLSQ
jgi:hypothetical protein